MTSYINYFIILLIIIFIYIHYLYFIYILFKFLYLYFIPGKLETFKWLVIKTSKPHEDSRTSDDNHFCYFSEVR